MRIGRVLIALIGLGLLSAPAASGVTVVNPDGTAAGGSYQRWSNRSLMPTPQGNVVLIRSGCPGRVELACAFQGDGPIHMGLPMAGRKARREGRSAWLHELGHKYDHLVLTDSTRDNFRMLRGDPRPWRVEFGGSPHEQFAEAYSLCAWPKGEKRIALDPRVNGGYGYTPTRRRHELICDLIRVSTP
jgi:hypothetical protein